MAQLRRCLEPHLGGSGTERVRRQANLGDCAQRLLPMTNRLRCAKEPLVGGTAAKGGMQPQAVVSSLSLDGRS